MNLNQLTVASFNIPKSVEFYKTLGLKIIVSPPHYARFEVPNGGATFSVHLTERFENENGVVVYFEFDDVDEALERLQSKGLVFEEMPENKRWLWREALIFDPDGNRIIFYHAGENRLNPPYRVKE